jgi:hypothetical protein
MHRGDITNEFLNDNRLAYAGPTIGTNLATLGKRHYQVNNLEARLQHLRARFLLIERGC